jgi:hypothetical protein
MRKRFSSILLVALFVVAGFAVATPQKAHAAVLPAIFNDGTVKLTVANSSYTYVVAPGGAQTGVNRFYLGFHECGKYSVNYGPWKIAYAGWTYPGGSYIHVKKFAC